MTTEMSDQAAINAECQAARQERRTISDGCARAIAASYHDGPHGVAFSTTGAIPEDPDALFLELFTLPDGSPMRMNEAGPERQAADMLYEYLLAAGPRGPVPGWSHLWVR